MTGLSDAIEPDDEPELEVTLTFPVQVSNALGYGLRELATHVRDRWVDDPDELLGVVGRGISDDYDLQVKPFSEP